MPPSMKNFASPPSISSQNILPSTKNDHSSSTSIDLSRTAVYQVDYTCVNAGKTISATKRRIRWRFGFANPAAIDAKKVGPECRGEEHEVILNWSLTSGKRSLLVDGNVLLEDVRPLETTVDFSWEMRGGHVMKVRGSVKPKMWKDDYERQFDLLLDGKSYHEFTQIFELGRTATRSQTRSTLTDHHPTPTPTATATAPSLQIPESGPYAPSRQYTPQTVTSQTSTFDFARSHAVSPANAAPAPTFDQILQANTPASPPVYAAPPTPTATTQAPSQAPVPSFAPEPSYAFTRQPSFSFAPAPEAPTYPLQYPNAPITPVSPAMPTTEAPPTQTTTAPPVFEGEETYIAPRLQLEEEKPDPSNVDYLMKKLCNLEDITCDPHDSKLTMMDFKSTDAKPQNLGKSSPIAPIKVSYVGAEPSLSQIKNIAKANSHSASSSPSKEVMKAPPQPSPHSHYAAGPGALVVHGSAQQSTPWNVHAGAPPLQRPVGFGVGAQLGQGYGDYGTSNPQQGVYASM